MFNTQNHFIMTPILPKFESKTYPQFNFQPPILSFDFIKNRSNFSQNTTHNIRKLLKCFFVNSNVSDRLRYKVPFLHHKIALKSLFFEYSHKNQYPPILFSPSPILSNLLRSSRKVIYFDPHFMKI